MSRVGRASGLGEQASVGAERVTQIVGDSFSGFVNSQAGGCETCSQSNKPAFLGHGRASKENRV